MTIKITLETAGKGAAQVPIIEVEPRLSEAEVQYCDCRASEAPERVAARLRRDRQMIVRLGLSTAGMLIVLTVGILICSIVANPLTAIFAGAILTSSLRAIVQLVGNLASESH